MRFLKKFLILNALILIKVGDSVIYLFGLFFGPFKGLTDLKLSGKKDKELSLAKPRKRGRPRKQQGEIYLIPRRKIWSHKISQVFAKIFFGTANYFKDVAINIKDSFSNIFTRTLSFFGFFLSRASYGKKIFIRKRKAKRGRAPRAIWKPSFFYKFKFFLLGLFFSLIFIFIPLLSLVFISDLPNLKDLSLNYLPKTTKIFDRNGALLYEIYANQNRTIVKLDEIPKNLKNATISIEDKDFYNHPGFDVRGISRALVVNVKKGELQGGSTITQQLIKSAFLTPDPSIARKTKEVVLAFWAERIYTKDQILELYFNFVPYGGTAWGIQSASQIYFGKNVSDLDLAQSAFLAGLPKAPSVYSPFYGKEELWKARQKDVLDAMVKSGHITKEEARQAYDEKLTFQDLRTPLKAPHFVMYIKDLLVQKYGLSEVERGGLQVKTSLDLATQDDVEKIVAENVDANTYLNISNGAALVTNPKNGDILAMVGSKNYFDNENDGNVNLTTSLRQPGSTIKMVTYALALSQGFTLATIIDDSPITVFVPGGESYTPVNYDGAFHGKVPLKTAFANSFNIPAVKVAQKLGPTNIVNFGVQMGISTWTNIKNYGLSITLGGNEVTMLDLANVYGTVANAGKSSPVDPILEVKDTYGNVVYQKTPAEKPVLDRGVAFLITDILSDNNARRIEFGTNSPLNIPGHRVSVKTGTTDNKRDNWTVGFTKDLVVATWVGNNDNSPMSQALASGITGAAPMWNQIMTDLLKDKQDQPVEIPENIIKKNCMGQETYFVKGTENSVSCNVILPTFTPTPVPQ